jgi:hypothetical protein
VVDENKYGGERNGSAYKSKKKKAAGMFSSDTLGRSGSIPFTAAFL